MVTQFRVPFVKKCSFILIQIVTADAGKRYLIQVSWREVSQWRLVLRVWGVHRNLIFSCEL